MTPRPFCLSVDAASREEPYNRYFGSLETALAAFEKLDEQWKPFAWIVEWYEPTSPIIHMRDGQRVTE